MTNGAAGAAVIAAIANASKAIGTVIVVEPEEFLNILERTENPLVVCSPASLLSKYKYLTSYKGLAFFTKSKEALMVPSSAEVITARKIEVPF
jgi:hypothetical protein